MVSTSILWSSSNTHTNQISVTDKKSNRTTPLYRYLLSVAVGFKNNKLQFEKITWLELQQSSSVSRRANCSSCRNCAMRKQHNSNKEKHLHLEATCRSRHALFYSKIQSPKRIKRLLQIGLSLIFWGKYLIILADDVRREGAKAQSGVAGLGKGLT